ncbi:disulfide bond formation protein B [Caldovatus aquaticus]|uniref:Disulfide bond formation protein B n=1 Tax=Caldovatus aquaticus TaxID=2865671 RepID=A0ABS7F9E0_9PROT|nr:disulfide bond formation protein B [Caldovatus aquaticus]MBW8271420.1 disulfide bond formation protein B [Caldovatus aquaticus]
MAPSATAALLVAALAAAAPLFARGSEAWWGLAPCALCLWQRWPYWVAAGLALAAALLVGRARAVLLGLAGGAVLASAAIAALHVGVEQGWWPSPLPGCQVPTAPGAPAASVEELMRGLAPAPTKPCDAPTYLIEGLPVSMAAMNLLYALGLGGLALALPARRRGER